MERVVFKSKNPRPTDGRMFIRSSGEGQIMDLILIY